MLRAIGIESASAGDRAVVKRVATLVSRRAARLAAMGVAGCVTQMGNSGAVSAGIDGSVFKKHPLVRTVRFGGARALRGYRLEAVRLARRCGRGRPADTQPESCVLAARPFECSADSAAIPSGLQPLPSPVPCKCSG